MARTSYTDSQKVYNMSDSDPFNDPDNWDEWGYKPAQRDEPMSEEDDDD